MRRANRSSSSTKRRTARPSRSSIATYRKHASVIGGKLGPVPVCELRAEQVTSFVSDLLDEGSPSRAKNVRTLLVQIPMPAGAPL